MTGPPTLSDRRYTSGLVIVERYCSTALGVHPAKFVPTAPKVQILRKVARTRWCDRDVIGYRMLEKLELKAGYCLNQTDLI